ncbi:unnamed protein product [Closterium sp. Naga37s-1]|nr:unnamed protein product [Closterium sp. Naga37s-1]
MGRATHSSIAQEEEDLKSLEAVVVGLEHACLQELDAAGGVDREVGEEKMSGGENRMEESGVSGDYAEYFAAAAAAAAAAPATMNESSGNVIDLDQVIARVPAHNTPLNANDDSLAYFDAGEVDCDVEDTADEDTDPTMATDMSRWEAHEVMQLAWIRHDYDAQYHGQTRLQGQNRDVMLFEKLRERHPEFRHNLAAVKAKVFRMEAQYRRVGDLLLNASGKGRPPKLPIFYDIFDRILGDRANARPPALAGSLPGANVVNLPSTSSSASKYEFAECLTVNKVVAA